MAAQNTRPIIFLAFANSSSNPLPHLAAECNRLTEVLEQAEQKSICELVVRPYATVEQILDTFDAEPHRGRIAVFHYAGHADSYRLLLEGADGAPTVAHAGGLAAFLGQQPRLQLVFLNGCSTRPQVEDLLNAGVNVVIATGRAIEDSVATDFATRFYAALANLDSIEVAFAKAQAAVQTMRGDVSRRYESDAEEAAAGNGWPWALYSRAAAIAPGHWNLSDAAMRDRLPFEPETVLVPAGPFLMGSEPGPDIPPYETPQHSVVLPAYRIGKFPVTNRQYAEFLKQNKGQDAPAQAGWFLRAPPEDRLEHPVAGVSWGDALAYCAWLSRTTGRGYRLPSEAEWEKAARGSDGLRYAWGDTWANGRCNVSSTETTPVHVNPAGASPYGCLDMLGNVQEWTRTVWGDQLQAPTFAYPYDSDDGREVCQATEAPPGMRLVHRGGSFKSQLRELRSAQRSHADPASRIGWRGFRVAMDP